MKTRTAKILGWTPAILVSLFFLMSAVMKFVPVPPGSEMELMTIKLGTNGLEMSLGVLQLLILALYVIPRTSTIGLIMMVGYLGGAAATNLTHGFSLAEASPIFVMIVLMMVSAWYRNPELKTRFLGHKVTEKA